VDSCPAARECIPPMKEPRRHRTPRPLARDRLCPPLAGNGDHRLSPGPPGSHHGDRDRVVRRKVGPQGGRRGDSGRRVRRSQDGPPGGARTSTRGRRGRGHPRSRGCPGHGRPPPPGRPPCHTTPGPHSRPSVPAPPTPATEVRHRSDGSHHHQTTTPRLDQRSPLTRPQAVLTWHSCAASGPAPDRRRGERPWSPPTGCFSRGKTTRSAARPGRRRRRPDRAGR
jgi:hypothetical protein